MILLFTPMAVIAEKSEMTAEEFEAFIELVKNILPAQQQQDYLGDLRERYTQEDMELLIDYLNKNGAGFVMARCRSRPPSYVGETAERSIEQLYANMQALYTFSAIDHMQTYTQWLTENNLMP